MGREKTQKEITVAHKHLPWQHLVSQEHLAVMKKKIIDSNKLKQ